MIAIRMLEDADGSPNGHTVHHYVAGDVYSRETVPPVDAFLMQSFVASKRAVECDAAGNPVGKPADKRATKAESVKPAKDVESKAEWPFPLVDEPAPEEE